MAYIPPTLAYDILRKKTCLIYEVLRAIHNANERSEVMRVIRKHPDTNRKRLTVISPYSMDLGRPKSTWYMGVHELTPTSDHPAAVNLTDTNRCVTCVSGFGGLGVARCPLVPWFSGSKPIEAVRIFKGEKSSARLPSERK
jgi:hypothetical protein